MKTKLLCYSVIFLFILTFLSCNDEVVLEKDSSSYIWPEDPLVFENLEKWQDLKFGMIIHWGLYSELGVVESWLLCSEEEDWIGRDSTLSYEEYKRYYWSTIDKFNPVDFNPELWAEVGKNAGMNYLVFTTKHHDGFCMFDTKQTDFSITNGAFKDNPRNNVAKEVFSAFRNEGFIIGAYFSKPDWHSQYYWWDRYATPNRNNNYDIERNPWRWNKFKEYTYNQIEELVNGDYGKIDILWLDGGWVRPARPGDIEKLGNAYKGEQDIDMSKTASMVSSFQPGILIVDRTVSGEFENYQTPERGIPEEQLNNPWESCITLGNDWGYTKADIYKSSAEVIHMLVEIVAKGGNLLLGIGPKPDGNLPEEVIAKLNEIGEWTSANGQAIYNTRPTLNYNEENVWFTQNKEGNIIYAIYCHEKDKPVPNKIIWTKNEPTKDSEIIFIPTGETVKWEKTSNGIEVTVPENLTSDIVALSFAFNVK